MIVSVQGMWKKELWLWRTEQARRMPSSLRDLGPWAVERFLLLRMERMSHQRDIGKLGGLDLLTLHGLNQVRTFRLFPEKRSAVIITSNQGAFDPRNRAKEDPPRFYGKSTGFQDWGKRFERYAFCNTASRTREWMKMPSIQDRGYFESTSVAARFRMILMDARMPKVHFMPYRRPPTRTDRPLEHIHDHARSI